MNSIRLVMKVYSPELCHGAALFIVFEFSTDEGAFELQRGKLMNLEVTRRHFSRMATPIRDSKGYIVNMSGGSCTVRSKRNKFKPRTVQGL